jgi:hypothetical protein
MKKLVHEIKYRIWKRKQIDKEIKDLERRVKEWSDDMVRVCDEEYRKQYERI